MNENNYYSNENQDNNNYENVYYNDADLNNTGNKSKGFAITSLVLGILSIILCCCGFGFIAAPLSIIFGIIALVSKRFGGKGLAVAGIILSAISFLFSLYCYFAFKEYINDYFKFISEYDKVIEEYEDTGDLPDYLEKYRGEEYEDFFRSGGYDDFDDFFEELIENIDSSLTVTYNFNMISGDHVIME